MVSDNSYMVFKTMYKQAVKSKVSKFMFQGKEIETDYAKYVCAYVDKHVMPAYDEHLINTVK
tara:strand:- start:213 stop:398 length:186 start_codon:yes stop_codon:yes gene_type:complete